MKKTALFAPMALLLALATGCTASAMGSSTAETSGLAPAGSPSSNTTAGIAGSADSSQYIAQTDAESIALTDADAERTFVSVRGAETRLGPHGFDNVAVGAGDVAIFSGYTLIHRSAEALSAFMRRTADHDFPAVFDTSPVIGQITDAQLAELVSYRPIWTCNEREGGILAERLGLGRTAPQTDNGGLCAALCDALHAPVVLRAGRGGAWVGSEDGTVEPVPGFPVTAVDTNGAGDCHTGVICAELCRGTDLVRAVRLANAAAAIAVTRHGPATCPTRGEAEALIARADEGRR